MNAFVSSLINTDKTTILDTNVHSNFQTSGCCTWPKHMMVTCLCPDACSDAIDHLIGCYSEEQYSMWTQVYELHFQNQSGWHQTVHQKTQAPTSPCSLPKELTTLERQTWANLSTHGMVFVITSPTCASGQIRVKVPLPQVQVLWDSVHTRGLL
jgi:hypothetical protein